MTTATKRRPARAQGLAEPIRERAAELGFSLLGFAAAADPPLEDHRRYQRFIAAGMHGEMSYLERHAEARARVDTAAILPGARTVICLASPYGRPASEEATDPPLARAIARYARGRDYHGHLRKRLRRLADFVRSLAPGAEARALSDTAPVLERAWARRAGLGFVGKNGLLIVPGQGSHCLLGEVVTTLRVEPEALGSPAAERCGSCRACLDACPTDAFAAPYVLDPRRCVAYLTIEARTLPPPALRPGVGEHLFGCDDCQDACPYNHGGRSASADRDPYRPLPLWSELSLGDLCAWDEASFLRATTGSPLRRARRAGLARNALLVAAVRARGPEGPSREAARALLEEARNHEIADLRVLAEELLASLS
jgi:epoxyqueuosine reductase